MSTTFSAKDAAHFIPPNKPTEYLPKFCEDASKLGLPETTDKARSLCESCSSTLCYYLLCEIKDTPQSQS